MNAKICYKIDIKLLSPLSVGSGANANTDKDIMVDNAGQPFIPATAIAGVIRSCIKKAGGNDKKLFGYISTDKNSPDKESYPSLIRVYDARCGEKKDFYITSRDCVKLEEKIAVPGAKFDMEAIEQGAEFTCYAELLSDEKTYVDAFECALATINAGLAGFGSKTSRGYGKVSLSVKKKTFESVDSWIDFDMFDAVSWKNVEDIELTGSTSGLSLCLSLKLAGGLSIREYTTDVGEEDETMPDYKMLSLHGAGSNPVIPGTSWAGAFLDRFLEYTDDDTKNKIFGFVEGKKKQKSKIIFSESILSGGEYKNSTRNSIDRFSAATKSGALYTEKTYFGGNTELEISFTEKPDASVLWALGACFADLHNGFMAVGGLTSVGRGLFEIEKINGSEQLAEKIQKGRIDDFVEEVTKNGDK